jgi:hypothetical protein
MSGELNHTHVPRVDHLWPPLTADEPAAAAKGIAVKVLCSEAFLLEARAYL